MQEKLCLSFLIFSAPIEVICPFLFKFHSGCRDRWLETFEHLFSEKSVAMCLNHMESSLLIQSEHMACCKSPAEVILNCKYVESKATAKLIIIKPRSLKYWERFPVATGDPRTILLLLTRPAALFLLLKITASHIHSNTSEYSATSYTIWIPWKFQFGSQISIKPSVYSDLIKCTTLKTFQKLI